MKQKDLYVYIPSTEFEAKILLLYNFFIQFKNHRSALLGSIIIFSLVIISISAPYLAPFSPYEINLEHALQAPNWKHPCGTDNLGRDILSRIIYGSRITLLIVFTVLTIATPIGLLIGMIAGYFNGKIDSLLMRITDIFLALPRLILALALVVALGVGLINAIIAIALTTWTSYARLVRAEVMQIRNATYIKAIRTQGASHIRIIFLHILPMCFPSLLVRVTLDMSGIILSVAGLGFLGLGAQPPLPEWGAMLSAGRDYLVNQWWIVTFPGLSIFIVSIGFNLLGDGVRDIIDPKYNI